jgi:replicative DNA helicase
MTVHVLHRTDTAVAAQQVFIGAVLAGSPHAVVELSTLAPDDFTDVCARIVVEVLQRRVEHGEPLEPVLVLRDLLAGGHAVRWPEGVGPGPWLYDALAAACPDGSAAYYAADIREESARRRLFEAGTRLVQAARSESLDSIRQLVPAEFTAACAALSRVVGDNR